MNNAKIARTKSFNDTIFAMSLARTMNGEELELFIDIPTGSTLLLMPQNLPHSCNATTGKDMISSVVGRIVRASDGTSLNSFAYPLAKMQCSSAVYISTAVLIV